MNTSTLEPTAASTRRRRRELGFSPLRLFANGEQGLWADPSDLTPEKISWRRNLLTWSEQFDNSAWTKSNASILSNLLTWSEDFSNAAWSVARCTISANTSVAPDGTTTADTLVEDTTTNSHPVFRTVAGLVATTYTASVFIKASGRNRARIALSNTAFGSSPFVDFDLVAVTATGSAGGTGTITDVGNGWFRCTATATATAGSGDVYFQPLNASGSSSYLGSGTAALLLWGAQLVPGTSAQTYTPTTSAIAPIQFTDPFGNATADKLVENTANAEHLVFQTCTSGVYVVSVYAKAAERSWLRIADPTGARVWYNLSNGTLGTVSGTSPAIVDAGNGWYRCSYVTGTATNVSFLVANGNGVNSYTGDGASGILLWGAQLEAAPTASSYQRITDFTSDFLAAFPTHALYQDSVGTTPVTALGQPVGLVLDKRLGGVASAGPELITNGGFTGGGTGWTTTGTVSFTNNAAMLGDNSDIRQSFTTVAGRSYIVQYEVLVATNKGVLQIGTTSGGSQIYSSPAYVTTIGPKQIVFTATGATTWFRLLNDVSPSSNWTVDTVSIREVPGSHAIQPTPTSRPTCDARVNLLTYSEQFENAAWTKENTTVTANAAVAPDGTTTADRITLNAGTANKSVRVTLTPGAAYVVSCYVKAETQTFVQLMGDSTNQHFANFNVGAGVVGTVGTACTASSIENVGNGWYRCIAAFTTGINLRILAVSSASAGWYATTADTGTLLLWGADLRLASDATFPYQRVVTASDYADVGAPRYLTFDGLDDSLYTAASVDFATWTSGTRRNLLTFPSAFDNSAWVKQSNGVTVTANATTSFDGTLTADLMTEDSLNNAKSIYQGITGVAAGVVTGSVYVKGNVGTRFMRVVVSSGASDFAYVTVNMSTGAVTQAAASLGTASNASAIITDAGNGWYRIALTATLAAAPNFLFFVPLANGTDAVPPTDYGRQGYTGNGSSWYQVAAQFERGTTATTFQDVGTDKVSVFTGVRKLSDAATVIVAEFGNRGVSQPGSFSIDVPGTNRWRFVLEGTLTANYASASAYTSPVTSILSTNNDLAQTTLATELIPRINGAVDQTFPGGAADAGTGNFGTYVLFIGRRNNASLPFNGRLYQLLVRGAASDAVTVQQTERWVAQRTGVQL